VILSQGIHDIPDIEYHADPAPEPSLSRSIAKLLIETSPAHAFAGSPRLTGAAPTHEATDAMDIGSAAHRIFLHGQDDIAVIPFPTYQSKDAKAQREAARQAGLIPLKAADYEHALRIVDALEDFRVRTGAFTGGKPEQTLIWQDTGHWGRCKVDWLPHEAGAPLWDLKTTAGFAVEKVWSRAAFEGAADMQAVHYARGAEIVRGEPPDGMLFCVVEQSAPYGIKVFSLSPAALEIGQAKCAEARARWVECLATREWPGYPPEIEVIEPPPWIMRQWEARTATGRALRHQPTRSERAEVREARIEKMLASGNFGG
jgi:hypothetical protein